MTCICAIEHKGIVWMGGDSAGTNGNLDRTIIADPKVFIKDGVGFGVCGLPKVMDAIAHKFKVPKQNSDASDRGFLVDTLVPALRDCLNELQCCRKGGGNPFGGGGGDGPLEFEGAVLIAYRKKVYELEGNFQLIRSATGYASVGSGSSYALGSLASTTEMKDPEKRILTALKAATKNAGVAPPFVIVKVK